jgi:tetratricopeptide (TPR) repeat protein
LLCLAADKGPRTPEHLQALPFPPLARHGSVSASVNFHALRAWAGWRTWLEARSPDVALGVYGLAQGHQALPQTEAAFAEVFGAGAPLSDELALQAVLGSAEAASAEELLAALVAQRSAPDAFLRLADALRARVPLLAVGQVPALVEALDRVGAAHFELGDARDVAFELATVLHRAGQLTHAARWYQRSVNLRGDHPTTRFNLALCRLDLADLPSARGELERVLVLAPDHARAKEILAQLP